MQIYIPPLHNFSHNSRQSNINGKRENKIVMYIYGNT